jgi:hypothetical protein
MIAKNAKFVDTKEAKLAKSESFCALTRLIQQPKKFLKFEITDCDFELATNPAGIWVVI